MFLLSYSHFFTLTSNFWSTEFGADMLWGKTQVQLFAQAWSCLCLSSLFGLCLKCICTIYSLNRYTNVPDRWLSVYSWSSYLFAFPMLWCLGHSQNDFSCPWGWRRRCHRVVAQRHPTPASNMGERMPKPCIKPGPTSPLIIAQATKRSEGEQTAAQLPLHFQLVRPWVPGSSQGKAGEEVIQCKKAASQPLFQQGLWESTALPNSMASALGDRTPRRWVHWRMRMGYATCSFPAQKGSPGASWQPHSLPEICPKPLVLPGAPGGPGMELCSCSMQGCGTRAHLTDMWAQDPQG